MQHNLWLLFAAGAGLVLAAPASGCSGNSTHPSSSSGGAGGTAGEAGNAGGGGTAGTAGGASSGGSESAAGGGGGSGGTAGVGGSGGSGGSSGDGGTSGGGGSDAGASGAAGSMGGPECSADSAESDCDDDNACTAESCDAMSCAHSAVTCDDNNVCTDDSCDPETGCTTSPHDCSDGDSCTFDLCDPGDGCSHPGLEVCVPTVGGCAGRVAQFSRGPALSILDEQSVEDTLSVSGLSGRIWGVLVTTDIEHTFNSDLVIRLTSPAGTVVTLSANNGGDLADVFAGSVWYDDAPDLATQAEYSAETPAAELIPQGPLATLRGEEPNGTWTLSISDDAAGDQGTLVTWGLTVATVDQPPTTTGTVSASSAELGLAVDEYTSGVDSLELSGSSGPICHVEVTTDISHDYSSDLLVVLRSPEGTDVVLTSEAGGDLVDAFAGTLFNDQAQFSAAEYPYDPGYAASSVSPEGAFDQLLGENGNGSWTLTVIDQYAEDDGVFNSWGLSVSTCSCE